MLGYYFLNDANNYASFVNYAFFSKKMQKFLLLLFTLNKEAVKVFWYSFSEVIPIFFNRFKSDFIRFLTTCLSVTSFKIWTFSVFLYIFETTRTNFFKSLHIIFIMHIIRSETFIEINSLQRLKISETNLSYQPVKNLRYNIHCFDVMLIFAKQWAL